MKLKFFVNGTGKLKTHTIRLIKTSYRADEKGEMKCVDCEREFQEGQPMFEVDGGYICESCKVDRVHGERTWNEGKSISRLDNSESYWKAA
jgi:hypothetical protein